MNTSNRVCALLGIEYPIIQAGMVWCSGWELAGAVSTAGGLGILGAGSMYPEVLRDQIQKLQAAAPGKPFAVNVPLLYPAVEEHMKSIVELDVPCVVDGSQMRGRRRHCRGRFHRGASGPGRLR